MSALAHALHERQDVVYIRPRDTLPARCPPGRLTKGLTKEARMAAAMKRARAACTVVAALAAVAAQIAQPAAAAEGRPYPDVARAPSDIADGVREAARLNRRVLLDFGGNWCSDCRILDEDFHRAENAQLLRDHYVVVHVNVGDAGIDHNIELAARYGVPLKKGVPAMAVLDGEGHVLFSQKDGEFESMKRVDPSSVHEFLLRWKP